jgi:hypothetical protein
VVDVLAEVEAVLDGEVVGGAVVLDSELVVEPLVLAPSVSVLRF